LLLAVLKDTHSALVLALVLALLKAVEWAFWKDIQSVLLLLALLKAAV